MNVDGPTRECWCGVHVHSGTKVVIWIQIIFLGICAVFAAVFMPLLSIIPILNLCLDALVLYGLDQKKPIFYKPYLFLTAISFCMQIGSTIYKLFESLSSTSSAAPNYIITAIMSLAVGAIFFYLYLIVPNRSCNLLEYELCNQQAQQIISFQSAAAPQVVVQVPTPQNNQQKPIDVAPPPYPEEENHDEHKEDGKEHKEDGKDEKGMYPKLPGNID